MEVFDLPELIDMIMCYGKARRNKRETLRVYQQQFPCRNHPHTQCLLNFINTFEKRDLFVLGTLLESEDNHI
jgi:hypothetical protein